MTAQVAPCESRLLTVPNYPEFIAEWNQRNNARKLEQRGSFASTCACSRHVAREMSPQLDKIAQLTRAATVAFLLAAAGCRNPSNSEGVHCNVFNVQRGVWVQVRIFLSRATSTAQARRTIEIDSMEHQLELSIAPRRFQRRRFTEANEQTSRPHTHACANCSISVAREVSLDKVVAPTNHRSMGRVRNERSPSLVMLVLVVPNRNSFASGRSGPEDNFMILK